MASMRWLALCLALASSASAAPKVIPMTLPSGKVLKIEVMVEDRDRMMGLMFRPSLPEDRGLLFVFEHVDYHAIWMKNCKFPIDVVWLDEAKQVVHVAENTPPCKADPCPVYAPSRKAAFVVEINAGQAAREKLVPGSGLSFEVP
jgi:uncharacterized membrane protein (UPF0127 family)